MTKDIERYFSRHAESFDRLYELPRLERVLNHVFRRALYLRYGLTFENAGDVHGKRILDVGCGSGRYALEFARRGAAEVLGIDVAEPMLKLAVTNAKRAGVESVSRFVCQDFMEFKDDRPFDVSIAIGVFDYLDRPADVLRHMRELTRGRILATFPGKSRLRMPIRRLRYALRGLRVFFYEREQLEHIAMVSGIRQWRLIEVKPSGGGYFLVGDAD